MKTVILLCAILGTALGQLGTLPTVIAGIHKTRYWPSDPVSDTYILPDSAELIVGPITSSFTCIDKIYGYYADIDNDCEIFHVCVPHFDEAGNQVPFVYSFFCGNQTVYDQTLRVCVHPQDALPCHESINYYSVNEDFGKTERPWVGPVAVQPLPTRPPPPRPAPTPRTTLPADDPRRFKVVEVLPDGSEAFVRDLPAK